VDEFRVGVCAAAGLFAIPYAAAQTAVFSRCSALAQGKQFPHVSLLLIGGLSIASSFFLADGD